jgi:hypothetical protein
LEFSSRQLRAFQLVAQHRSFYESSGSLFISTSGLSGLLRGFQTQLGCNPSATLALKPLEKRIGLKGVATSENKSAIR